jgi:hypothetical protein
MKHNQNLPPPYQHYIIKPSKVKSLSKPLLGPNGILGEKMTIINSYGSYKDINGNPLVVGPGLDNSNS